MNEHDADPNECPEFAAFERRREELYAVVERAHAAFRARDWPRTRDLFRAATAASPRELLYPLTPDDIEGGDAWLAKMDRYRGAMRRFLGICCVQLNDPWGALAAFEAACQDDPTSVENWGCLGAQELRLRRWRDAWRHFRRATALKRRRTVE